MRVGARRRLSRIEAAAHRLLPPLNWHQAGEFMPGQCAGWLGGFGGPIWETGTKALCGLPGGHVYRKQGCLPLARVVSQAGADYFCHGELVQPKFMTSFSPLFKLCDGIERLKKLIR